MSLPYVVTDEGTGLTAKAFVNIVVFPASTLPAKDDYYQGAYNTPLTVKPPNTPLSNDGPSPNDPTRDLNITTILADVPAADGNLTRVDLTTGAFVFVPKRGFYGNTTFTYGACLRSPSGALSAQGGALAWSDACWVCKAFPLTAPVLNPAPCLLPPPHHAHPAQA